MRKLFAVLYTALALGANAAHAEAVAGGDSGMNKLTMHESPADLPEAVLLDAEDAEHSLDQYRGKWVVLNFWATWCAPCKAEMPSLDRLQAALPDIAVLPVASGRNDVAAIDRFYTEAAIVNLPVLRDPKAMLARQMGIAAMPVTVILNPDGQEVGRLIGDAVWDSPAAISLLQDLMTGG
jgi:thiol-disulfide isomerase/thioredoxin